MDCGGQKWHPFHSALIWGKVDEAKRLYEEEAEQSTLLTTKNPKGWAALHFASHSGRPESVEWLLGLRSCDPSVRTLKGETALHLAAAHGHEKTCDLLLKGRCPPEAVTREGRSALHYSAEMGHVSVTRLLVVGAGISPDTPDSNGATAAALALAKNHKPVLRLLEKSHPGVMLSINTMRRRAFLASPSLNNILPAVADRVRRRRGGQVPCETLFEPGAGGPGVRSGRGARSIEDAGHRLLQAARIGDTVMMAEVLAKGNIGVDWFRRSNGRTAVMEAAESGSLEGVCFLGDKGADLERSNKKGMTVLQLSVRSGHLAVAEELLRRGARPNVVTKAGLCLRCLAQSEGHNFLTDWLLANGVADGENGGCACVRRVEGVENGRLSVRPNGGGSGDLSSGRKLSPPDICANGAGARWEKTNQMTALGEWLEKIGLSEYEDKLVSQGFDTLEAMTAATEPDLEEMGFKKGHLRVFLARAPSATLTCGGSVNLVAPASPVTKQPIAPLAKVDVSMAPAPIGPTRSHFPVAGNGRPIGGRTETWGKETPAADGHNGIGEPGARVRVGEEAEAKATGVHRGFHDRDDEVEGGPYCDAQALDPTRKHCMGEGNANGVAGEGRAGAGAGRFKELSPEEIEVSEVIGEGSFGIVRRGHWRGMDVAVKELKVSLSCFNPTPFICTERVAEDEGLRLAEAGKPSFTPALANADTVADLGAGAGAGAGAFRRHPLRMPSSDGEEEMRHEAKMLSKVCNHDCVVQFVGVLLRPVPSVVTRFMENGSVENLLVSSDKPATKDLVVRMASEAAKGVIHLHREGVVHRDLASRNLLLNDGLHVRISDFGFSRVKQECASRGYTRSDMGPIKWTSPEAMRKRCYSEASDVFSFGVVLYEMFVRRSPWEGHENLDVAFRVCSGERMTVPDNVDEDISGLMFRCWEGDPRVRPDFPFILDALVQFCNELVVKGGDTPVEPGTRVAERGDSMARAAAAKAAKEAVSKATNCAHLTASLSGGGRVEPSGDFAAPGARRTVRRDQAGDRGRNRDRGLRVGPGRGSAGRGLSTRNGRGPPLRALDHAGSGRQPCPTGSAVGAGTGDSVPSADSSHRSKPRRALRAGPKSVSRTKLPRGVVQRSGNGSFESSRATPSRGGGQRGGEDVRRGRVDGGRGREA